MSPLFQAIAVGVIIALAVLYLVWKIGFAGNTKKKPRRRGIDVPANTLVRKRPGSPTPKRREPDVDRAKSDG